MTRTFLILCLFFSVSAAMAKGNNSITFDYDYQRPGGDYTSFTTSTAQECSRKCEASNHCQAFDFWESDHSCWLKDRSYPGQRRIGVISGEKKSTYSGNATAVAADMDISYDTQRPGGDYTRFPADSAQQCAQRCAQDARCVAFDYTTVDYYCYLKTWSPPARRYRDIISGVKRPFYPQVKSVQELLIQQHYNPGPADGLMGRQTRIALEKYQRDINIPVTGRIDDATLIALGLRQPIAPVSVTTDGKGQKGVGEGQQFDTVSPKQEGQRNSSESDLLYIKTVGVTYLQIADNIYANILAKIPAGEVLQVLSEKSDWYKVSYNNQVGFVLAESVEK